MVETFSLYPTFSLKAFKNDGSAGLLQLIPLDFLPPPAVPPPLGIFKGPSNLPFSDSMYHLNEFF